jgi:TolB protein
MKFPKLYIFLGLMIMLMACSGQEAVSTPKIFATLTSSPRLTNTTQPTPTLTSVPTITITPTPDACSEQTIPANILLSASTDVNQEKLIALETGSPDNEREVFIMGMDGKITRDITNHPADDVDPKWSPDGKRIAFLSNRNGKITTWCNGASDDCMYQLFSVKPDGTGLRQITKDWTFQYSWSPDSKQIAFLRAVKSDVSPYPNDPFLYEIYAVNSDGTNLRNLTNYPGFYHYGPIWSPDGTKLAFLSGDIAAYPNSINVINSDGTELSTYSDLQAYEVTWTADNGSLLFTSQPDNHLANDIYKMKLDLSDVQKLTFTPNTRKEYIAVSPDGKWLAYHSQTWDKCDQIRAINIETGQNYFVYDAHDVGKAALNINRGTIAPSYDTLSIQSINWMPNGDQIIFNQMVLFDMIFGEFEETFSIQIDGTVLKEFGDRSGSYSFQP